MRAAIRALACIAALATGCTKTVAGGDDTGVDPGDLSEVLGILVTPERVAIPIGQGVQLKATGLLADRSSLDVTHVADWGSDDASVAAVSDGLDEEGVITGLTVGSTEVWAQIDAIRSVPVSVSVTGAELIGLQVVPDAVDVEVGQSVQLRADAAFSDGSRADASAQVIWVTGDGAIVTMEAGGTLNGVSAGFTAVHADWDGTLSAEVPVQVVQTATSDLRFEQVTLEGGPADITVTATVKNSGSSGASDFWVDLFVDRTPPPVVGDVGVEYELVPYLGPGKTALVSFNRPAARGPHTITLIVDTDEAVEEDNESNNVFSGPVTVGGGAGGPNLFIPYFDYIADETSILYAIEVRNGGTEDVGEFWLDLWVDETLDPTAGALGDEFLRVDGVDAGDTEYADFLVDDWCLSCTSWVMVDTNDEIEETDEDDNVAGPLDVESP